MMGSKKFVQTTGFQKTETAESWSAFQFFNLKLSQFTKISTSSKLTIDFSEAKIYVSFSMFSLPYSRLASKKSSIDPLFSSSSNF
jgi:hypothetical protein